MKKIIFGAALLLAISSTRAAQTTKHNDEHNILSTALPAALRSDIKKDYGSYWITELTQDGEGKHAKYLLTLENADQVMHLRAGKTDSWEVLSTSVKAD
jgi:hypothetical protein